MVGDELVWHWNTSGTHTVIYHVTDDDGVRVGKSSQLKSSTSHQSLNQGHCLQCLEACLLDATGTIDSINDLDQITIVWDLDTSVDSNGMVSRTTMQTKSVNKSSMSSPVGSYSIRVIAWDENPERPELESSVLRLVPRNVPSWRNWVAFIGDEANPVAQLSLLAFMLLVLGMMTRRRRSGRQQRAMDRLDQQQNAIFGDEEVGRCRMKSSTSQSTTRSTY